MAKRRRVLMGMGALVFGSGAMSVNAVFNDSVSANGDMRVLADDSLLVEPGTLFRDGTSPTDTFDPSASTPVPSGIELFDRDQTDFFGGLGNDGLTSSFNADDAPAVSIDDETNNNIQLQTLMLQATNGQFGDQNNGVLQVRNQTNSSVWVAIRYKSFGDDVSSTTGDIDQNQVADVIQFKDSNNNQISPTAAGVTDNLQEVEYDVEVPSGGSEQVWIDYNTNSSLEGGNNSIGASKAIENAATTGNNQNFGQSTDTVQLLKELKIGTDPDDTNVVNPQ